LEAVAGAGHVPLLQAAVAAEPVWQEGEEEPVLLVEAVLGEEVVLQEAGPAAVTELALKTSGAARDSAAAGGWMDAEEAVPWPTACESE
jgi:hypothetical protein